MARLTSCCLGRFAPTEVESGGIMTVAAAAAAARDGPEGSALPLPPVPAPQGDLLLPTESIGEEALEKERDLEVCHKKLQLILCYELINTRGII